MDNNELVSIIIPVYNVEDYLERCIESVINQTYTNIEVILVNDGSTDKSEDICRKFAKNDKRLKIISQRNQGVSCARNTGIMYANGDYIGFVDPDDFIDKSMYEKLLLNMKKYNASISVCAYTNNESSGNMESKIFVNKDKNIFDNLFEEGKFSGFVWNKLYARKLIYKNGDTIKFKNDIKALEDLLFNYYIFKECNCVVYSSEELYHYIIRENSALTSKKCDLSAPRALKIIMDDIDNEKIYCMLEYRYVSGITGFIYNAKKRNFKVDDEIRKSQRVYIKKVLKRKHVTIKQKIKLVAFYTLPGIYLKLNRWRGKDDE